MRVEPPVSEPPPNKTRANATDCSHDYLSADAQPDKADRDDTSRREHRRAQPFKHAMNASARNHRNPSGRRGKIFPTAAAPATTRLATPSHKQATTRPSNSLAKTRKRATLPADPAATTRNDRWRPTLQYATTPRHDLNSKRDNLQGLRARDDAATGRAPNPPGHTVRAL
jgi:hypothetical protein